MRFTQGKKKLGTCIYSKKLHISLSSTDVELTARTTQTCYFHKALAARVCWTCFTYHTPRSIMCSNQEWLGTPAAPEQKVRGDPKWPCCGSQLCRAPNISLHAKGSSEPVRTATGAGGGSEAGLFRSGTGGTFASPAGQAWLKLA